MLLQEELQKKISDFLAVLEVSVENRVMIGWLDQNLVAQSFIAGHFEKFVKKRLELRLL
jgi:hypothetical protein